jgi:hypothetical protein
VTFSRYTLRPTLRAALVAFLVHHNPFYLLSALCMVAACFALNQGLSPHAGEMTKLLALLGTLNLYEAILIALGLYLIRRRGIFRDGRTLLLIEAPFLFDLMFLNTEAGSASLGKGALVASIALAVALAKMGIVLRVLYGRLPGRAFGFIGGAMAALFLLPSGFKWMEHNGAVRAVHFYLAWCIVGLLLAAWEMLGRLGSAAPIPNEQGIGRTIRRLYMVIPLVSLAAHLGMLHWVYRVDFAPANLAPVLLGLAIAAGVLETSAAQALRIVLPALAMLLSLGEPALFHTPLFGRVQLTPAMVAIASAYLVYVYSFFFSRAIYFVGGAIAVGLALALGPTFAQARAGFEFAWRWTSELIDDHLPRTALQWGLAALAGAFGFLGIGAAVSLRKPPPTATLQEPAGGNPTGL